MKVLVTFKTRYTGEIKTRYFNAVKVTTDTHFINITDDKDDLYSFQHSQITIMRIEND